VRLSHFVVVIGAALAPTTAGKTRITVNGAPMTATLIDSATTRDFVSLLPLTIPMRDLFGREKSGDLPRSLSEGGEHKRIAASGCARWLFAAGSGEHEAEAWQD
jgi:hypothetical protein